MRLLPSSKIAFRKSRPDSGPSLVPLAHCLLPALLLVVALPSAAQLRHAVTASAEDEFIEISIVASGVEPQSLFATLDDGLSARLDFEIRALERRSGAPSLLGPRLIREFTVIHEVRWDPFRRRYVITTQDGASYPFRDEASLWAFLFTLPEFRIPWSGLEYAEGDGVISRAGDELTVPRPDALMIETRVVYHPIVFVPGLSILSVFLPDSRMATPWQVATVEERP